MYGDVPTRVRVLGADQKNSVLWVREWENSYSFSVKVTIATCRSEYKNVFCTGHAHYVDRMKIFAMRMLRSRIRTPIWRSLITGRGRQSGSWSNIFPSSSLLGFPQILEHKLLWKAHFAQVIIKHIYYFLLNAQYTNIRCQVATCNINILWFYHLYQHIVYLPKKHPWKVVCNMASTWN